MKKNEAYWREKIDDYLLEKLSEEDRAAFEEFCFTNEDFFEELRAKKYLIDVIKAEGDNFIANPNDLTKTYQKKNKLNIWLAVAVVVFLVFVGAGSFLVRNQFLPVNYEIAKLDNDQKKILYATNRNDVDDSNADSSGFFLKKGAKLLAACEKSKFFIIPYFDIATVDSSISFLSEAYTIEKSDYKKNQVAFFLGKANLMKNDYENSKIWFEKIISSKNNAFKIKAKEHLSKIVQNR